MREEATSACVIMQESLELIPGVSLSVMLCPYSHLLKADDVAVKGFSAAGHKQSLLCNCGSTVSGPWCPAQAAELPAAH